MSDVCNKSDIFANRYCFKSLHAILKLPCLFLLEFSRNLVSVGVSGEPY